MEKLLELKSRMDKRYNLVGGEMDPIFDAVYKLISVMIEAGSSQIDVEEGDILIRVMNDAIDVDICPEDTDGYSLVTFTI